MKKKKKGKKQPLSDIPKEEWGDEADIHPELLNDGFQFHNPPCSLCGSQIYSAFNVDETGEIVVLCNMCPQAAQYPN